MILGLSLEAFTQLHTGISLIGILSGLIVLFGMVRGRHYPILTGLFLATTVLTSVTGFFFPISSIKPSHVVGAISLVALAATVLALVAFHLRGVWRWVYVVGAIFSLYLNVFVGIVQAFQKLSFLQPLAPTQSEPPFIIAQAAVLLIFLVLGVVTLMRFHPYRAESAYAA